MATFFCLEISDCTDFVGQPSLDRELLRLRIALTQPDKDLSLEEKLRV